MTRDQLMAYQKGPSLTVWLTCITVFGFMAWAAWASIDEIVRAQGSIVPASRPQVIQNLEGGILSELMVDEGDKVTKGQIIAKLQDKKFRGAYQELQEQVTALEIRLLRLNAEQAQQENFDVPEDLLAIAPLVVSSERALLRARLLDYNASRASIVSTLELAEKEVNLLAPMVKQKLVAPVDMLKAEKTLSEVRTRLQGIDSDFAVKAAEEYADTQKERSTLVQTMQVRQDQLERTVVRSPVNGVINNVAVTTIGGVIRPGEEILKIIPLGDELLVEAKVAPQNIGFIYPSMKATTKLTAYDYTIYGSLNGTVEHVSADTFKDERDPNDEPYYKVMIRVPEAELAAMSSDIDLRPGLTADVEFHNGQRTVMNYILKPLYKASQAMREP